MHFRKMDTVATATAKVAKVLESNVTLKDTHIPTPVYYPASVGENTSATVQDHFVAVFPPREDDTLQSLLQRVSTLEKEVKDERAEREKEVKEGRGEREKLIEDVRGVQKILHDMSLITISSFLDQVHAQLRKDAKVASSVLSGSTDEIDWIHKHLPHRLSKDAIRLACKPNKKARKARDILAHTTSQSNVELAILQQPPNSHRRCLEGLYHYSYDEELK